MAGELFDIAVPLLAVACAVCALYRLATIFISAKGHHLRTSPKGPSYVLAFLGILAALFLAIPPTIVWGLFLAAVLGIAHIMVLWKPTLQNVT